MEASSDPRDAMRVDVQAQGDKRAAAQRAYDEETVILRAVCRDAIESGMSESEVARLAGVRRQTVREWIGKTS